MELSIQVWVRNTSSVVAQRCTRPGERGHGSVAAGPARGPREIFRGDILVFLRQEGLLPLQRQNLPFSPLPGEGKPTQPG